MITVIGNERSELSYFIQTQQKSKDLESEIQYKSDICYRMHQS